MTYTLGVDLGTTFTAAAVDDGTGAAPLRLGDTTGAMPSVVAFSDGEPVTGDAAEQVLRTNPAAGVREAKRRLGDSTPMVVDGTPYGAEAILGLLLADVVQRSTTQQGAAPDSVVLAHPANWGEYKKDLLSDTARVAGLDDVGLITEPQAAAIHYVRSGELELGQSAAVYDFGGGTFDAAVVRCAETGPELLGEATGLERLGGIDLDQAILMHVNESVDGALRELDASNPAAAAAMAAVRAQCIAAKEALSTAGEADVKVALPGLDTVVRLTRSEFEGMLRPRIADTLKQLDAALASADLAASDLGAVLLVGGTSRIPLVGEMVGEHTGVKVVAPSDQGADHKTVVCAGAAAGDAPVAAAVDGAAEGGAGAAGGAFVVTGPAQDPERYRGGVNKRRLAILGGAGVVAAAGLAMAGAAAAGAVSPSDLLGGATSALGFGEDGGGEEAEDLGAAAMAAAEMDAFDDVAPEPAPAAAAAAAPAAGYASYGATPMARAATVSSHGASSGGPSHASLGGAPHAQTPTRSTEEPGGAGTTAPGVDPEFAQTKARLLESIRDWEPPEGTDPEAAEAFRQQLIDRIDRFQPMPGESTEHARQALRDEYHDQVKDFVQDQRFEDLEGQVNDLLEERAEEEAARAEIDEVLSDSKAALLERLEGYEPPEGIDPEAYAEMREDLEALIERYQPVPGQTAEEAMEELRFQYANRVKDLAQDTKLEGVAQELGELADEEDDGPAGHWERGRDGEPGRVWVDQDGTRHYDREVGPTVVRDHRDGETEITYGRAYRDRASDPPTPPTVTENDDGTVTVTFTNEQGRHITIRTTESPEDAVAKYRQHNPAPQQSGSNLSPELTTPILTAPVYEAGTGIVPDILLEQGGFKTFDEVLDAQRLDDIVVDTDASPAAEEEPVDEQEVDEQQADGGAREDGAEEPTDEDADVVGDDLDEASDLDEPDQAGEEAAATEAADEAAAEDEFAPEPGVDEYAPDETEYPPVEDFEGEDTSDAFAVGGEDSADEFDTADTDPTGDDTHEDPVLG